MVGELCRECNNWFVRERYEGEWAIVNGKVSLPFMQNGQFFRVLGSVRNDGVYQYGYENLSGNTLSAAVFSMAVPDEFVELSRKIDEYKGKNPDGNKYQSESFDGYSYTMKGDGSWQDSFKRELNRWRKL